MSMSKESPEGDGRFETTAEQVADMLVCAYVEGWCDASPSGSVSAALAVWRHSLVRAYIVDHLGLSFGVEVQLLGQRLDVPPAFVTACLAVTSRTPEA